MKFNEDSRVKIPVTLHLMRLGYEYLSLKDPKPICDESTNIFTDIFHASIRRINPVLSDIKARQCFDEVSLCLENEDLGQAFYEKLTHKSGTRLIDFENFNNNIFNVVTELTYKKMMMNLAQTSFCLLTVCLLFLLKLKSPTITMVFWRNINAYKLVFKIKSLESLSTLRS